MRPAPPQGQQAGWIVKEASGYFLDLFIF